MKKIVLLILMITSLFSMELWEQKAKIEQEIFKKNITLLKSEPFEASKFDFFNDTATKLNIIDELEKLKSSNTIEEFLKSKALFLAKMESSAYDKKLYDLIDGYEENIDKEALFSKKIKNLFVKLEKSDLKTIYKPLEMLFFIKEYLDVVNKPIDEALFENLYSAIKNKDKNSFTQHIKELQKIVASLKSTKLPQDLLEKEVKSFLRYNKLTAFDYKNGVDDEGNIKNSLEYTEAVIFSARAKERILSISGNLDEKTFNELLNIYEKIITNIQNKTGKKEVSNLTKEAKKLLLEATRLKEVKETPKELVENVINSLNAMEQMVEKNDFKGAEFFRLESYSFFDPDIEGRLIPRDPSLANKLEGLFWDGYGDIKGLGYAISKKDKRLVTLAKNELEKGLKEAQKVLETKLSYSGSFVQSAMIIVREGLEAILVIAILLSLFTAKRSKFYLYLGVALGIVGSFVTYYAAKEIISISTSNRELIEGVSALIASAMLIFVTAWIFHNTYSKGWVEYAKELTQKSMKSGSLWTLLFIGFIVVYREGFETVLFYETLANESDPQAVWFGFLAGLFFIIVVSVVIVKGIKKLPINLFFSVTGVFLSLLAVIFTGAGIRGLQTANIISATPSDYLHDWQWLRDYFGYSPTLETTLSQIAIVLLLFIFFMYSKGKKSTI